MGNAIDVQYVAQTEPWRTGLGRPRNLLDPIWADDTIETCHATPDDVEWEPETSWWWCRRCGHCSSAHFLQHRVVESPVEYHELSLNLFFARRAEQKLPADVAQAQALYAAGAVLRVAASKRPEEFEALLQTILELAN